MHVFNIIYMNKLTLRFRSVAAEFRYQEQFRPLHVRIHIADLFIQLLFLLIFAVYMGLQKEIAILIVLISCITFKIIQNIYILSFNKLRVQESICVSNVLIALIDVSVFMLYKGSNNHYYLYSMAITIYNFSILSVTDFLWNSISITVIVMLKIIAINFTGFNEESLVVVFFTFIHILC